MKRMLRLWTAAAAAMLLAAWLLAPRAAPDAPPDGEDPPAAADEPSAAPAADARTLRVRLGGEVKEMSMADYLTGVLRAEMPASFEAEALRAQAVAARTYTLYKMAQGASAVHPDADACDDIACCKAYASADEAAARWGVEADAFEAKLRAAVADTDGEIVTYDGEPILAVFFSSAAGRTQSAGDVWQEEVAYLTSVPSPEDASLVPDYRSTVRMSADDARAAILRAWPGAALPARGQPLISALQRNDAGYVESVRLGALTLRGNDLRTILGLRSPCFTVEEDGDELVFSVTGYGHGVGMSQYGANALARQGLDHRQILAHYYPGTALVLCA